MQDEEVDDNLEDSKDLSPNSGRKQRKQYVISKTRENWTEEEHTKFLEALKLYDRDWKKIEKFIETKTVIQIRSHAQKHFMKVLKNGTGERIPPPRPKRKSAQMDSNYPPKKMETVTIPWVGATENVAANPQLNNPAAFAHWMASNGLLPAVINTNTNINTTHAIEMQRQQQEQLQQAQQYLQQAMATAQQNQRTHTQQPDVPQGPNFSKIYSFLGSLFDPNATNHMEAFHELSPIDKETVHLLMHNLTINIANQQFREQHNFLLEQYRTLIGKSQTEPTDRVSATPVSKEPGVHSMADVLAAPFFSMNALPVSTIPTQKSDVSKETSTNSVPSRDRPDAIFNNGNNASN